MKEKKCIKTKIGVGYVVRAEVGEMEDNTKEGRGRIIGGMCTGCGGEEEIISSIQIWAEKDMRSCLLMFLCSNEEVDMDETLSNLPEKEQGELLIIDGGPEVEEPCIFQRGMYLSVFYFLCYVKEISKYI